MASETLQFDIVGNSSSATKAFKDTAEGAGLASKAAAELDKQLRTEIKTAEVAKAASLELAKADKILADAELVLAGRVNETSFALKEQGKQADETAVKLKVAGDAASGAGGGFGAMGGGMGAAIAAGVALAPVIATVGLGLGGLGLAALGAVKDTKAMGEILGPLKSDLGQFQAQLKPEVLGLFGQAAGIAERGLKSLEPVAAATGGALSGFLNEVGTVLSSGQWQQFFQFMERNAAPDVALLGSVMTDLLKLLPPLLEDLQQDSTALLGTADAALKAVNGLSQLEHEVSTLGGSAQSSSGFLGVLWESVRSAATTVFNPAANAVHLLNGAVGGLDSSATQLQAPLSSVTTTTTVLGTVAAAAAPKIGTLAGDMGILAQNTQSGNTQLAAFNDLANLIIGNSLSAQQAVLADAQAFAQLQKDIGKTGSQSVTTRAEFVSYVQQVLTNTQAMVQHGAAVSDVNKEYLTNIARLESLHGLTATQRGDIQGLVKVYDEWAQSTIGLSSASKEAASAIGTNLLSAFGLTAQKAPQVSRDITALSDAILKTGTESRVTAADRQQLIKDLEKAGLSAQAAQALVQSLQGQISSLKGKDVAVKLSTSGSGDIIITGTGITTRKISTISNVGASVPGGLAAGGLITGGVAGRDSVPIMAMPGELVVPTSMVAAGAVDHLRGLIPGFAAGGVVGRVSKAENAIGTADAQWAQLAAAAFAQAAIGAVQKAAAASSSFISGAPATGSAAAAQAFALRLLPAGWSWPALQSLWTKESGWNAYAVNPSSGAYGIPQALPAVWGHPYALGDYANQVRWGLSYIAGRYGNSQAAWAHEVGFNWYDNGGLLQPGLTLAYNGTGRPEQVIPPGGSSGGDVHVHLHNHGVIGSQADMLRWLNNGVDELARTGKLTYALRRSPSAG